MLELDATFIFAFISFLIFIFLMKIICYAPITKIIAEREKFYEKNKQTVSKTKTKIESVKKEFEREISKTKLESSKMLKNATEENQKQKSEILSAKKVELSNSVDEFKNSLSKSANNVKVELRGEISGYVKEAVSRIIKVDPSLVNIDESRIDEVLK